MSLCGIFSCLGLKNIYFFKLSLSLLREGMGSAGCRAALAQVRGLAGDRGASVGRFLCRSEVLSQRLRAAAPQPGSSPASRPRRSEPPSRDRLTDPRQNVQREPSPPPAFSQNEQQHPDGPEAGRTGLPRHLNSPDKVSSYKNTQIETKTPDVLRCPLPPG